MKNTLAAYRRPQEEARQRAQEQAAEKAAQAKELERQKAAKAKEEAKQKEAEAEQKARDAQERQTADLEARTYNGKVYSTPEEAKTAREMDRLREVAGRTYNGHTYDTVAEAQMAKLLDTTASCHKAEVERQTIDSAKIEKLIMLQRAGETDEACKILKEQETILENTRADLVQCSKDLEALHTPQAKAEAASKLALAGDLNQSDAAQISANAESKCK